jgi:hypothetical protein
MNAGTLSNRELAAIVEAAKRMLHMLTTLEQITENMVMAALSALNSARLGSRGAIPKQAMEKAIAAAFAVRFDYMPTMDEVHRFMVSNPKTSEEMIAEIATRNCK